MADTLADTLAAPRRRVDVATRHRPSAWSVFVVAVALLASVGGVLAVQLVRSGTGSSAAQVEGSVSTSFGSLEVHQSEVLNGLSSAALGGMSHGVQNLVGDDKAEVAVTVTLVNDKVAHLRYAASQFRLRTGNVRPGGARVSALGTSLSSGTLDRGGSIEGTVNFVTPLNGKQLWLEYTDHGKAVAVRLQAIALPAVGNPDGPNGAGHQH
jgi:Domain of unknown function (DUF4352)